MKYCPITYEPIADDKSYSEHGLKLLSPQLKQLNPLPYSAQEQRDEAIARAGKISIQGVQDKLSAKLNIKDNCFEVVDHAGQYILKPPNAYYPELPANEAITMTMAKMIGLQVPVHGLLFAADGSMTYFIKRFDRKGHGQRIHTEDFSQLSGHNRDTKYTSSMEKVAKILSNLCSFPKVEAEKLFKLCLFNYLIGNEDMHLKNFSLIEIDKKVSLTPAYDLLNTSIAQKNTKEELALPLNGKKNNLLKRDLIEYFGSDVLQLSKHSIDETLGTINQALPDWKEYIGRSFLSAGMKDKYLTLLNERVKKMGLG